MLGRAIRKDASPPLAERKYSPLQANASAINANHRSTLPAKRKLDRRLSTTSTSLASLHQQPFDENSRQSMIDLTSPSPEKPTNVAYPRLPQPEPISYPSLPPNPTKERSKVPPGSAEVPWSSSPPSHFEPPSVRPQQNPSRPQEGSRPSKKRTLPASFSSSALEPVRYAADAPIGWTKAQSKRDYIVGGEEFTSTTGVQSRQHTGQFDQYAATPQAVMSKSKPRGSSAMNEMLEKATSTRPNKATSMSRMDKSVKSFLQATDAQKTANPRLADAFLSDEQRAVVKAVMDEGKSVFFTGSAGTGKSVLMRAIIAQLKHKYRTEPDRIAITASTGLASCILEGQTLHSWSGIGLGKEPAPELVKKIKRNSKSRQRWLRTKVLIIDEISMVDGLLFDKLEQIARTLRNNGRPFGGIQLIFTGDFFQLPPVPDRNTEAKFVFDAVTWNTCIQHTILLTHVFRQKDEQFATMLNEMRLGKMSAETIREFKKLSRPLNFQDELEATELYPRREEVENANQNRMRKLSGQVMTYDAVDSGVLDLKMRQGLLSNFIAPATLDLKKGSQVMLIKNIDTQLVNGSLGIVQSFMDEGTFFTYRDDEPTFLLAQDEGTSEADRAAAQEKIKAARSKLGGAGTTRTWPMVRFNLPDGTSRAVLCTPDEWKTEAQNGEVLAKRVQVPLILAWALSIHKAQGQTLNRVKVDLRKVFEKGQAYVALSRATSKEGLQVLGFDERKVMVHSRVLHFYSKLSGHETLLARKPSVTTVAQSGKHVSQAVVVDDFDDDDLSYEEILAAEQEALRASRA